MKRLINFIIKEFKHIIRDPRVLLILFGMPVVQVLIFGFALTNEIKNSKIIVIDFARDEISKKMINKIEANKYFEIIEISQNKNIILDYFREGKIKAAIIIPANLSSDLNHSGSSQIQIITDATDVNFANSIKNFIRAIINDYQSESLAGKVLERLIIVPEIKMLYNPQLKGAPNFVPGVMSMVMLLVCVMMTAIAIVREKEIGSMEVLLTSPVRPIFIIISKVVPYFAISTIDLTLILLLSVYVLDLPIQGSLFLLIAESLLFIFTCLNIGILISIRTSSQQIAMLMSLVGMMMPTVFLSGFMFPIENMPYVLQLISNVVPSKWFYIIVKDIMLKGAGFEIVWKETLIIASMMFFFFLVSFRTFKVRLN
ncbi:MAG: ABC transporter permease [Candidatus Kapabacteria bacterium]|nr:ABC transporter permease [Candidatus Kapabacteria bacterium]